MWSASSIRFGGVTYLYENVTKEIQLESRYNELIGVQRETLDNLEEAIALFGSDGRLKLFNPGLFEILEFRRSLPAEGAAYRPACRRCGRHGGSGRCLAGNQVRRDRP